MPVATATSPRLLVLLSALCFGTTGTATALGPEGIDPSLTGATRILIGGGLLAAFAWRRDGRWSWRWVLVGAGGVATFQLAFFGALDRTGVAVGTVVALGSAPVFTALLAPGGLTRRWAIATALAIAGVAMLMGATGSSRVDATGVSFALLAGFAYAVYAIAGKRLLLAHRKPEAVMARLFGIAAVLLIPVLAVQGVGQLATSDAAITMVYLGVVPTALGYALFARGLQRLQTSEVTTLTLAEPLTAAVLAAVVLGERPGAAGAAGTLLILGALVLLCVSGTERTVATSANQRRPRMAPRLRGQQAELET